jgi:mono/diheme cytochrome c family protein
MFGASIRHWLLVANIALVPSASLLAQDIDRGRIEFLSKCATCHGPAGRGDGPHSVKLKAKPPNLTTLAKRNKGVFSQRAVYDAIDGRKATGSHRIADMPIWGCRHTLPTRRSRNPVRKLAGRDAKTRLSEQQKQKLNRPAAILDLACDPESVIRSRILAVVEYLRQIQE